MIIELKNVNKNFKDTKAVIDMSFSVKKGEVVGFVGANGAGKSTTITMLLGMIKPTSGSIVLFDNTIKPATASSSHHMIGYAAGDMSLPQRLSGKQYLDFVSSQYKKDVSKRRKQLEEIFLPELDKKIHELSRGNKQKLALIAAFLTSPNLIILDEPTSGLDPIMQEKFLKLIKSEQNRGVTIFMSSHYLNEIAEVCTRIILMRKGRIIRDSPASKLLENSGKKVRIVTGYARQTAPKNAEAVAIKVGDDKSRIIEFNWKRDAIELQVWLASVKQLRDIEVTEYDVEMAFHEMYDDEKEIAK